MTEYYKDEDLDRFEEVGKYKPDLFRKFMDWYNSALDARIKSRQQVSPAHCRL
jgi:hypothetical protein